MNINLNQSRHCEKALADEAISQHRQYLATSMMKYVCAFGYKVPVLADCFASLAMTNNC